MDSRFSTRYTKFRREHDALYEGAAPYADAALVLPRQSVRNRRPDALDAFRTIGRALVERQVLIDVIADETLTLERLSQYPVVILPNTVSLSDQQIAVLGGYAITGRLAIAGDAVGVMDELGNPRRKPVLRGSDILTIPQNAKGADVVVALLREIGGSTVDCPWTVRATAYLQPQRVVLHLVNYDREAGASETNRAGPKEERPRTVESVAVDLRLPPDRRAVAVTLHAPDQEEALELESHSRSNRVVFEAPRIRVYGVVAVETRVIPQP